MQTPVILTLASSPRTYISKSKDLRCIVKTVSLVTLFMLAAVTVDLQAQIKHPYLFFTSHRLENSRRNIKSDTVTARQWQDLKNRADRALNEGHTGNLELLSLAWQMTHDRKYANAAKRNLLHAVDKKQWD